MAKKQENAEYKRLKAALAEGSPGQLYIFYGEERYLLEYYLSQLRQCVLTPGMEEFNQKRFSGRNLDVNALADAIDALPVFAERTLVEVSDFDIFKSSEEVCSRLLQIFSDLPAYVTVVFVYDTVEFKADTRIKRNAALKKCFSIVEFTRQEQSDLLNWIARRFKAQGKKIDKSTAEYFSFVTGGLMTAMIPETEKVAAYTKGDIILKENIDAVVTPVLDAAAYKVTDSILKRDFDGAAEELADLLAMQEAPHRILYSISQKMRQLLAARICCDSGRGLNELMDICGIRYEFQARGLMTAARRLDASWCKSAVQVCSQAALRLNSGSDDGGGVLAQLLVELAAGE